MDNQTKRKYALFANAAYKYPQAKQYLSNFSETRSYTFMPRYSGQYSTAAMSNLQNEIVLALRGTDTDRNYTDLVADVLVAVDLTQQSYRYNQAEFIFKKLQARFPRKKITVVGHSLGGAIASKLFEKFQRVLLGVFYNPAPLKGLVPQSALVNAITNYTTTQKKGGFLFHVSLDPISAPNIGATRYEVVIQDWNPTKGHPHKMTQFL